MTIYSNIDKALRQRFNDNGGNMYKYLFDEKDMLDRVSALQPTQVETAKPLPKINDAKDETQDKLKGEIEVLRRTLDQLTSQRQQCISTLDLDRCKQLSTMIDKYTTELNECEAKLNECNNTLSKEQYKQEVFDALSMLKDSTQLDKAREMYGEEIVDEFIRQQELKFNFDYLKNMDKSTALGILENNAALKNVLKDDYNKLVDMVKSYVGEDC